MSALPRRVQPIDATPSNLARGGGVRWRGLHGYGSRRSRGLSFGSAGRTVNVWRISLGRLRGGTRAVCIVSWLSCFFDHDLFRKPAFTFRDHAFCRAHRALKAKDPTNKEPPAETGGSFLRRGALFLLAALLAALSGLLSRLLLLLTRLLLAATTLLAALSGLLIRLLGLLPALIWIILSHWLISNFWGEYCLNIIIQTTDFT